MTQSLENEIKEELCKLSDATDIGHLLYKKSLKSGNMINFLSLIEKIKKDLTTVLYHVDIYIDSCKETIEKRFNDNYEEDSIEDIITGYGRIEVIKQDDKIKIILDAD